MPHIIVKKEVKTCTVCLNIYNSFKDTFDLDTCSQDCYGKKANSLLSETQLLTKKLIFQ